MRIGFDFRPALQPRTGIGRYAGGLAGALAAGGADLRLYGVFFRGNRRAARRAPHGSRLVAWKFPARVMEWLGRTGLLTADAVLGGCDVFHHTNFLLLEVRRLVPQVMTVHDLAFLVDPHCHTPRAAAAMRAVVERAARTCDALLAPSEATARAIREHLGVPRDRVFVTPLGVDPSFFATRPCGAQGRPYLLAIGTLEPRKNHARLIRAFLRSGVDAELRIAGKRGWLADEVLAAARGDARVRLLGHVPENRLRELLADAHAVAYPSLLEGFGLPVLEALAAGRPVLTSDREPLRSLADGAALLADPEDEEALADAIRRIVEDSELRAELVRRGPERARRFTWRRCAEETLRAYRAVAS